LLTDKIIVFPVSLGKMWQDTVNMNDATDSLVTLNNASD